MIMLYCCIYRSLNTQIFIRLFWMQKSTDCIRKFLFLHIRRWWLHGFECISLSIAICWCLNERKDLIILFQITSSETIHRAWVNYSTFFAFKSVTIFRLLESFLNVFLKWNVYKHYPKFSKMLPVSSFKLNELYEFFQPQISLYSQANALEQFVDVDENQTVPRHIIKST